MFTRDWRQSGSSTLLFIKKWNESGFRPPLCTYRLNWARRTSWGCRNDWDDTVFQTQDSKFEPWRSEAEHATSRSRRLPAILTFTRGWGRNIFCFFQTAETGNRTPNSGVKGSGANHYPRALISLRISSSFSHGRWIYIGFEIDIGLFICRCNWCIIYNFQCEVLMCVLCKVIPWLRTQMCNFCSFILLRFRFIGPILSGEKIDNYLCVLCRIDYCI